MDDRLEKIKRNQALIASLGLAEGAATLKVIAKPTKKVVPARRKKREAPTGGSPAMKRRSLRVRGYDPDGSKAAGDAVTRIPVYTPPPAKIRKEGHIPLMEALAEHESLEEANEIVKLWNARSAESKEEVKVDSERAYASWTIDEDYGLAKVTHKRVYSMALHPTVAEMVALVGDTTGQLGVWFPERQYKIDDDPATRVVTFQPHSRPVTSICVHRQAPSVALSCSYDGSIRSLDFSKSMSFEVASTDELLTGMDMDPESASTAWVSTSGGELGRLDVREEAKKLVKSFFVAHDRKIGCISINGDLVATSSHDNTVKIWDKRKMKKSMNTLEHGKSVTSAYFSPSGRQLVTTSLDNFVRVWTVDSLHKPATLKIPHNNHTGRWLSNFRTVFDPVDEDVIVIGSMDRTLEFYSISSKKKTPIVKLRDENLTAVPTLTLLHPVQRSAVSTTASGRAYYWQ